MSQRMLLNSVAKNSAHFQLQPCLSLKKSPRMRFTFYILTDIEATAHFRLEGRYYVFEFSYPLVTCLKLLETYLNYMCLRSNSEEDKIYILWTSIEREKYITRSRLKNLRCFLLINHQKSNLPYDAFRILKKFGCLKFQHLRQVHSRNS